MPTHHQSLRQIKIPRCRSSLCSTLAATIFDGLRAEHLSQAFLEQRRNLAGLTFRHLTAIRAKPSRQAPDSFKCRLHNPARLTFSWLKWEKFGFTFMLALTRNSPLNLVDWLARDKLLRQFRSRCKMTEACQSHALWQVTARFLWMNTYWLRFVDRLNLIVLAPLILPNRITSNLVPISCQFRFASLAIRLLFRSNYTSPVRACPQLRWGRFKEISWLGATFHS